MSPEDLIATSVERRAGVVLLTVTGEIDLSSAPHLAGAIDEVLAEEPAALIIDLSGVDFLASVGLQLLGQTGERSKGKRYFAVVATGPTTLRPIRLTGIDSKFELHTTVDDALREIPPPIE
ncbi:hypothetical protein A5645_06195 [Mycobacterium asiaticum]|uniref:STAS domain-containing protein n=1 Tax=Mycobacterium asiaticum TaxID=1790 RepID=UPI0007EFC2CB|nr:STAS domain-containing protein [Mycobacterium asiaticum]OBK97529.1 hypothetical protein A5645_06195 [Mycobacterium asiaticum]